MKKKIIFCLTLFLGLSSTLVQAQITEAEFTQKRKQMIETQIKMRGVRGQRVLAAMLKVKRHLFVPSPFRHLAYGDHPVPIGEGQTISQPYIVALMTELLDLKGDERVLEIGTGAGYQAAILAELSREVYTIEILEPLASRAENLLKDSGYKNIKVKRGDGFLGWPEFAPFDAIVVTCAPEEIPPPLIAQLTEGGRLVIPVGEFWQELKLVRKIEGKIKVEDIIPVSFVPMLREKMNDKKIKSQVGDEKMAENLKRHIKVLSYDIGERNFTHYKNLEKAKEYIKQEFKNYGFIPEEQVK